jgi:hypothetical protein
VSDPDADHYRYRALLKDADDEPKRLALIQLLIDEKARERLVPQLTTTNTELLPEHQPYMAPVPTHREVPPKAVETGAGRWPVEINTAAAADETLVGLTHSAPRPGTSELGPPALLLSQPPEPEPFHELAEPTPQKAVATLEKVTIGPVTSIPSEPSRPGDLADRIAKALSGRAASANAGPVAPMALSSGAPPAASDVEIAARIEAALMELTRVHGPRDEFEYLGGDEARLSLPAPSETPSPEAMRSVPVVRGSTHDLIARFVRLMSKRLVLPSAPIAPQSDDEEENSIVLQIQAALAKQKRDG